jgi:hypothetical protein
VPDPDVHRRRLVAGAVAAALALASATAGALTGASGERALPRSQAEEPAAVAVPPSLPRGGRDIFPRHRVVAYYGAPQSEELGALGIGTPAAAARRLERQARPYARPDRPVLPALELIAVIANREAGADGRYRARQPDEVIERYLRAARRAKALLLLDIQPGTSDFFAEARWLERWLREPDVGLALDPEWRVAPGQVPGEVIGRVDSAEVNVVTAWLAKIVREGDLPEKLVVIHQFTDDMVDDTTLEARDGLQIVLNADGFGTQPVKKSKYDAFTRRAPGFEPGLKVFYEEDVGLMTPRQVLRLRPPPDFVVYE